MPSPGRGRSDVGIEESPALSESLLRTLTNEAPAFLWAADASGQCIFVSSKLLEFIGTSLARLSGWGWFDYVAPEDRGPCQRAILAAVEQGIGYEIEYRLRRADGEYRWMLARSRPHFSDEGGLAGYVGSCIDLTERRIAEGLWREAAARNEAILESSIDCIILVNGRGRIVECNRATEKIFGYRRGDLLGVDWALTLLPARMHGADQDSSMVLQDVGAVPRRFESPAIRSDRSEFPAEIALTRVPSERRSLFAVNIRDISDRARAHEAIRREREQLRGIIASAPVAMALFDREMRCLTHSELWLEELGIAGHSIIGRSPYEMLPGLSELWHELSLRALEGEVFSVPEHVIEHPDGRRIYSRWSAHPWREPSGEIGGIVIATHVINELVEARDAALELSRRKAEFLADMSHEIRTPLNGILGMADALLDTGLDDSQRSQLDLLNDSAVALLGVINGILDLSKIEAGVLSLESLEFDLDEALAAVLRLLAVTARRKGLELSCRFASDVPLRLIGDPTRFRQIVMNLVGNAIKFTDRGEVAVNVAYDASATGDGRLHFEIRDTGIGIAAPDRERILSRFVQARATGTTRAPEGSGLGLTISSHLVAMMGGELWFESEAGKGSTFHFTACFGLAPVRDDDEERSHLALVNGDSALLVDGHATSREILEGLLLAWRMRPRCVATVAQGLKEIEASRLVGEPFGFVLADSRTADLDALLEAVERSGRSGSPLPTIVLLALDGRTSADDQPIAREHVIWVEKPVRPSELLERMAHAASSPPVPSRVDLEKRRKPRTRVPGRVLLVEDNGINRLLGVQLVEQFGHIVSVATNGREAVAITENQQFDLILMDLQMPELDGFDAAALIRRRERETGDHIPIVALTAHAVEGYRERVLDAGMDGYVSKPIDPRALFETMEKLLPQPPEREESIAEDRPPGDHGAIDDLRAWVDDDAEILARIADLFRKQAPEMLARLRSAAEKRDARELARTAHGIKGYVGFRSEALAAADRVERLAYAGDLDSCIDACGALLAEMELITRHMASL